MFWIIEIKFIPVLTYEITALTDFFLLLFLSVYIKLGSFETKL